MRSVPTTWPDPVPPEPAATERRETFVLRGCRSVIVQGAVG